MSEEKIHGKPEEMRALSRAIDSACLEARMAILRMHAHLEAMPDQDSWNDRNQREFLERYAEARRLIDAQLDELSMVALQITGLADRYEQALG